MPLARMLGALAAAPLVLAGAAPAAADTVPAAPLTPSGPAPTLAAHTGKAFKAHPVPGVTPPPQNPQMAPNPKNNVHNDTWMTDNYSSLSGPLAARRTSSRPPSNGSA
jgi:hypothetical protein